MAFSGKSDNEVAKSGRQDSGFCNPVKIRQADEAHSDAVSELMDRGYSRDEAESKTNGED